MKSEIEKLIDVSSESQVIGEFLDTCGYFLCEQTGGEVRPFMPVSLSIEELLAEYFGIDLKKLEDEKRALLEQLHSNHSG